LESPPKSYKVYYGSNVTETVQSHASSHTTFLKLPSFNDQDTSFYINFYRNSCIGISTEYGYKLAVEYESFSNLRFAAAFIGLVLFLLAPKLCSSVALYYGSSVIVGVMASLLIVIIILSKFLPKKIAGVIFFLGSSATFAAYRLLWEHLQTVLSAHVDYLAMYVGTAGTISFAVAYYFGPPSNPRALNLIQWLIQGIALFITFMSTDDTELLATSIVTILTFYNIPYKQLFSYYRWIVTLWY